MTNACSKAVRSRAGSHRNVVSAARRLLRAGMVLVAAMVLAPVSTASAAPSITITSPSNGSVTNDQAPFFSGTTDDPCSECEIPNEVTVTIYAGESVTGKPVQPPLSAAFLGDTWTVGPAETLAPGTYTALAEQFDSVFGTGQSAPVTFTIDTTAPQVSVTPDASASSPASGSQVVGGSAGTAPGDLHVITVQLFAGSTIGAQAPLETLTVPASGGSWSATFGGLSPGTYTVLAEQRDAAGNSGISAPASFAVTAPPPPPPLKPPTASFKWFPLTPKVGERVSLVSSSIDHTSAITAFAWAMKRTGAFHAGKPVLTTSFATPGAHIVRLRVTSADGLSSVATATIRVIRVRLTLMDPFPIVRIAGIVTSSGANLSLLTAQAPAGARVTVTCRGHGCPSKSESRIASSPGKKGPATMVVIAFRRFQRSLGTGASLVIRISKRGQIGKYTRFVIRRRRLPERVDACLGPARIRPIACPS
jgi:methionine-rich copper-binding protein CopC